MGELLNIPVDSMNSSFKQRVELDDAEYVIKFDWNGRLQRWHISLMDGNEVPLVMGITLVTNTPLFNRFRGTNKPQGVMILYNSTGISAECGREGLGVTHFLLYEATE